MWEPGADLLTQASREILVHMVGIIFSRLGDLPALDLSAEETLSLVHSPRLAVRSSRNLSNQKKRKKKEGSYCTGDLRQCMLLSPYALQFLARRLRYGDSAAYMRSQFCRAYSSKP